MCGGCVWWGCGEGVVRGKNQNELHVLTADLMNDALGSNTDHFK